MEKRNISGFDFYVDDNVPKGAIIGVDFTPTICGRCGMTAPASFVSHESKYGRGRICQKCSDREIAEGSAFDRPR